MCCSSGMGIVVWVSAGALESFFFFFSFCADAGGVMDKKIAKQTVNAKSARKLRADTGTGFAAIGVLSLQSEGATRRIACARSREALTCDRGTLSRIQGNAPI